MKRAVQCYVTGEKGTPDVFYKPDPEITKHYFKDKATFDEWYSGQRASLDSSPSPEQPDDIYDKLKEFIYANCLRYTGNKRNPGFKTIVPKIDKLRAEYSDEIIMKAARECEDSIMKMLQRKSFQNDAMKAHYIFGMIDGNIAGTYERCEREKKERERIDSRVYQSLMCDEDIVMKRKRKVRDISHMFDDEEDEDD